MTYAIIATILLALELIYFKAARRMNIIDRPGPRSSHNTPTIRGGGIIFLIAPWLAAAFFGLGDPLFLTGLTLVGLISFADDLRSLPVAPRLAVQTIATALMLAPLAANAPLWTALPALFLCLAAINAFNFMDGINGITPAYALAIAAPLIYLNSRIHFIAPPLLYTTTIAIAIFATFNFRRHARTFAGDVGSITLAFTLTFATAALIYKTRNIAYITLWAVYGTDTLLTLLRRMATHQKLTTPHRSHAYQILANHYHLPHLAIAAAYALLQTAITIGLLITPTIPYTLLTLIALTLLHFQITKPAR